MFDAIRDKHMEALLPALWIGEVPGLEIRTVCM